MMYKQSSYHEVKRVSFALLATVCLISLFFTIAPGKVSAATAIDIKYQQLGGANGFLGSPTINETTTPDGVGRFRHYQNGSIYWHPNTGAHEVHGLIRQRWAAMGWELSVLGYPTTDETVTPDGIGRFNHFQWGSIYWTNATGAHEVYGDIRVKWANMGWETSFLGYPTSGEADAIVDGTKTGRISHFQGGYIYWNQDTFATYASKPLQASVTSGSSTQTSVRRIISGTGAVANTDLRIEFIAMSNSLRPSFNSGTVANSNGNFTRTQELRCIDHAGGVYDIYVKDLSTGLRVRAGWTNAFPC